MKDQATAAAENRRVEDPSASKSRPINPSSSVTAPRVLGFICLDAGGPKGKEDNETERSCDLREGRAEVGGGGGGGFDPPARMAAAKRSC